MSHGRGRPDLGFDPNGYGEPPGPARDSDPTGREILLACWSLLRQDRSMFLVPLISGATSIVFAGALFGSGWLVGGAFGERSAGVAVGVVLALVAMAVVGVYFQVALVIAANQHADGHRPTIRGVTAAAGSFMGLIVAWTLFSLVALVVFTVLEVVLERFLGIIGRILDIGVDLAWAIASYLVIPVLVVERVAPIEAVRRSSAIIKDRWGTGLRTTLRLMVLQLALFLPALICLFGGLYLILEDTSTTIHIGFAIVGLGLVALIVGNAITSAMNAYAQTMIYRYCEGYPIPIAEDLIDGAFMPK